MLSEVHVIIYTCVFTCVTSVPCAPVLVGNPGSGRNAPVTLWHADIKIYITTNTANCVNSALMRELVLMILEEDIALCMQNFCIRCHRHGILHIPYIYFTLYLYSILTTWTTECARDGSWCRGPWSPSYRCSWSSSPSSPPNTSSSQHFICMHLLPMRE